MRIFIQGSHISPKFSHRLARTEKVQFTLSRAIDVFNVMSIRTFYLAAVFLVNE